MGDVCARVSFDGILLWRVYRLKAAGLKYARPMMIPFAIILFSAAFLPVDLLSVIKIESEIINTWGWAVTFAFIGLVMIAAGAGKRAGRGLKADEEDGRILKDRMLPAAAYHVVGPFRLL